MLLATLLATRKWFRFSGAACLCFGVWAMLQTIGAHYTFEDVLMGWLKSPLSSRKMGSMRETDLRRSSGVCYNMPDLNKR